MEEICAMEFIQVQITFPTMESAKNVAKLLVERRLAACVQIVGKIRSEYIWNDEVENNDEILLLAKTRLVFFDEIIDFVRGLHPYVCPQIIALPIIAANDDYIQWMNDQLKKSIQKT
ncbi:MAG: divalent-cation tolerance protein CutA [Planctomycetaceae bacterium]|jgi:periplasmic divalent cation tolerance protein|nr:divalent-cation tolerance protein CutA [Planctomycetaceae bacterium]